MIKFIFEPKYFFSNTDKINKNIITLLIVLEFVAIIILELHSKSNKMNSNLVFFAFISKMICYPIAIYFYAWMIEKIGKFPEVQNIKEKIFKVLLFSLLPLILFGFINLIDTKNQYLINIFDISLKVWSISLVFIGFKVLLNTDWRATLLYTMFLILILFLIGTII